jgi:TrmH family RNA methyltransferase
MRAIETALEGGADVRLVVIPGDRNDQPPWREACALAAQHGVPVRLADDTVIEELTDTITPSGIIASVAWEPVRAPDPEELARSLEESNAAKLLCLDAVADPGNMGSLIRSADAFGLDGILLGTGSVECTNPKVVRSSVGSLLNLPLVAEEVTLFPVLRLLSEQGWAIFRAEVHEGQELRTMHPTGRWILLLGSEGHGVSDELTGLGEAIRIAMTGAAESLNVAVAGGILLHGLTTVGEPPL